jgi:hypothetical protein
VGLAVIGGLLSLPRALSIIIVFQPEAQADSRSRWVRAAPLSFCRNEA